MYRMEERTIDGIAKLLLEGKTCQNCACTYDPNQGCSNDKHDFKMKYGTCLAWEKETTPNVFTYSNCVRNDEKI